MLRSVLRGLLVSVVACTPFESGVSADTSSSPDASTLDADAALDDGGTSRATEILAAGLSNAREIAANAAGVFWTSTVPTPEGVDSRPHRCDLAGCAGKPSLLVDERAIHVALTVTDFVWTTGTSIRACTAMAACEPRTVRDDMTAVGYLIPHDTQLLFTTSTGAQVSLQRCRPDSCSAPSNLWDGESVGPVAPSSGDVYFVTGLATRELRRVGAAAPLGALPGLPTGLAMLGSHAFFVSKGLLYHCEAATTCTAALFSAQTKNVHSVVTYDGAVYFSVYAAGGVPGSIQRCSPTDCSSPEVLMQGGNPRELTVYDGWLYFIDAGDESTGNASVRRTRA